MSNNPTCDHVIHDDVTVRGEVHNQLKLSTLPLIALEIHIILTGFQHGCGPLITF